MASVTRHRKRRLSLRKRHHEVERADQISWELLIFGVVRTVAWCLMMLFVLLGLVGIPAFHWASHVATLVVFVTFISFYANAATDLDGVTAAWAAIRAGRAHAQGLRNEQIGGASATEVLERIENLSETIYDHQLRSEDERG